MPGSSHLLLARWMVCALLPLASSVALAQETVRLADGDSAGLAAALASGASRSWTRIVLAPGGTYSLDQTIALAGEHGGSRLIEVAGNGARITLANALLVVSDGITLRVSDAEIRPSLQRSPLDRGVISPVVVGAGGDLHLERSAVVGGRISGGRVAYVAIVHAEGRLLAENTTFADNTIAARGGLIANFGAIELVNSSLAFNRVIDADGLDRALELDHQASSAGASAVVRASIIEACSGPLPDDGSNLSTDARCGFAATVDDLALGPLEKTAALVPTLAPRPWSPAQGAVAAAACLATDARGLSRLGARCDAGAHQRGAGAGRQDVGGVNGTWFQPDNDGHYVVVNRNSPTELVVIWMTFDRDGNQAWVYTLADFDGSSAAGPAFVNRDGVLGEDGVPRGQQAEAWGTMQIRFDSCDQATLSFASDSEAFGSGTVALGRLSQVDSLGCAPLDAPSR